MRNTILSWLSFAFKKTKYLPSRMVLEVNGSGNQRDTLALSLSDMEKIAKSLNDFERLDIIGVNPFLNINIVEIIELFLIHNHLSQVAIVTDGKEMETIVSKVKDIFASGITSLSLILNLNNLDDSYDDSFAKKGALTNLLKIYKQLTALNIAGLSLEIKTTLSNKNINDLQKIISFVKDKMPGVKFQHIVPLTSDSVINDERMLHINSLDARKTFVLRAISSFINKMPLSRIKKRFLRSLHRSVVEAYLQILKNKKMPFNCYAGYFSAFIHADGKVSFCQKGKIIGNLADYQFNFPRLWYSFEARKVRAANVFGTCYCFDMDILKDTLLFSKPSIILKNFFKAYN